MQKRGKRGQVTVFIIVAIAIVVIAGGIYLFTNNGNGEDKPPLGSEAEQFKVYMGECINDVLEEGVILIGYKGGYYSDSDAKGVYYYGTNVPYYFYNNEMTFPTLKKIENNLLEYLDYGIDDCVFNFDTDNFNILIEGNKEIKINFRKGVSVNLYYPISLINVNSTVVVSDYEANIQVSLKEMYNDAQKIVILQSIDPYHICLDCIEEVKSEEFFVEGELWENNVIVYSIIDYSSIINEEPYKFYFAIKYPKYDCASLPKDIDDYIKDGCEVDDG